MTGGMFDDVPRLRNRLGTDTQQTTPRAVPQCMVHDRAFLVTLAWLPRQALELLGMLAKREV